MKARVYLSLGALLLFLAPLSCSDKAESPAPETPPEEQPVQPSEEYKEMYHSMEDNIKEIGRASHYPFPKHSSINQSNKNVHLHLLSLFPSIGLQIDGQPLFVLHLSCFFLLNNRTFTNLSPTIFTYHIHSIS